MATALLDGDIIAFRSSVAGVQTHDWGDGVKSTNASPEHAQAAADSACSLVEAWRFLSGCKDVLVAFTGRNNFRYRVLPTYKWNRSGKVKPMAYEYTVQAVRDRFPTQLVDGLEGDDLLGILATTLPKYVGAVVMTLDKDLQGIPGLHLNPLKDKFVREISEPQADRYWLSQVLTGDDCDGYKGLPKVGPKKADKILGGPASTGELWSRVLQAYLDAGLTETDALQQARVARILRRCDFDKATKEVLLWHPTTPVRMTLSPTPT